MTWMSVKRVRLGFGARIRSGHHPQDGPSAGAECHTGVWAKNPLAII